MAAAGSSNAVMTGSMTAEASPPPSQNLYAIGGGLHEFRTASDLASNHRQEPPAHTPAGRTHKCKTRRRRRRCRPSPTPIVTRALPPPATGARQQSAAEAHPRHRSADPHHLAPGFAHWEARRRRRSGVPPRACAACDAVDQPSEPGHPGPDAATHHRRSPSAGDVALQCHPDPAWTGTQGRRRTPRNGDSAS